MEEVDEKIATEQTSSECVHLFQIVEYRCLKMAISMETGIERWADFSLIKIQAMKYVLFKASKPKSIDSTWRGELKSWIRFNHGIRAFNSILIFNWPERDLQQNVQPNKKPSI